jgi:integral membrane protein
MRRTWVLPPGGGELLRTPIGRLRAIAWLEGWSYLLLLFAAMPLKYLAGEPGPVRVVGAIHGGLFLLFCAALFQSMLIAQWPLARSALIFWSALVPFGTFAIDRRLSAWESESMTTAEAPNG